MIKNQNSTIKQSKSYILTATNEIRILRRTQENNTHEVIEDTKIKRVTSWRKSDIKFKKNLIFNILSFGILHLISLYNPNIYIKLYCIPWPAKECDFFLVENIYGKLTLCQCIHKKNKNIDTNDISNINENGFEQNKNNIYNENNNVIKHVTYSFEYNSCRYEYDVKNNIIIPIYMDLSKMMNRDIFNFFVDGLSTERLVQAFHERYGKNEYKLNIYLLYYFFIKTQIPSMAIVLFIGLVEYFFLKNYIIMLIKILLAIGIIIQYLQIKISFINKYSIEYTLDGNNTKIKVKRKYLSNKDQSFINLNINELLPGDIILLNNNDYVPCDCIILHGECLTNESDLTGSLNIYKKIALKNNSEPFNYKYSNINILYHGMKIIKIFSKLKNDHIIALCINIGPNTYKANQYSNTLYLFERKKEYKYAYNIFGERKKIFLYIILNILICLIITILYYFLFLSSWDYFTESNFFKDYIPTIIVSVICKSLVAVFFIIQNILIFFALFELNKSSILCFDKSRLMKAGNINTIIFNKTKTLSATEFKLYSYHPIEYNDKSNKIIFKNYLKNESKDLNKYLFDYYRNFVKNKTNNKYDFSIVLFLECLLCCNNIEIYDMEFFGNDLEIELFNDMKWNIKENNENNAIDDFKYECLEDFNTNQYYITKKITEIFPQNYYKIGHSSKINNNNYIHKKEESKTNRLSIFFGRNILTTGSSPFKMNQIQKDITNSLFNLYKLRIYKKFIFNGSLNSASIVFNLLTKELRFMIKGTPEEIIDKCNKSTLPKNFEKYISFQRKKGLIILVCATRKINIDEYDDNDLFEHYMEDLTFIGFIALKNEIKSYVKKSINDLKYYNNNFKIISGDNVYNCLSAGFNSGIIENKNIFVLDKEQNNKIIIRKIYSCNNNKEINETNDKKRKSIYTNSKIKENISNRITSEKNDNDLSINLPSFDNIQELEINKDKGNDKKTKEKVKKRKTGGFNEDLLINENSEFQRIIKKEQNNSNNNITSKNTKKNQNQITSNIDDNSDTKKIDSNYLIFMKKYYYHDIFKEYADVKNGIFCLSGKLFNYLISIKAQKGVKNFLNQIIPKTQIFFNMSSIDKSLLVDYFREIPTNTVCVIGQCDSDIDSILSSDIGISLQKPKNMNTILSHFYSDNKNISCIKDIIITGKVFLENNVLLESMSFVCSMLLNGYILCSLLRNVVIDEGAINFLEIEYLILSTLSFLGKTEEIKIIKNNKLFQCYYYFQLGENILFKLLSVFLFCYIYKGDLQLENDLLDIEFQNYIFVMLVEFLICGILSFNFMAFYKESAFYNHYLLVFINIYLIYITLLIFLNSSNFSVDLLSITAFQNNENIVDCYTDKNRYYLFLTVLFDFCGTVFTNWVTLVVFSKIMK